MERPHQLTAVAFVAMVGLQLLFGVARLCAGQPWGGRPFALLSFAALALAGVAQTVTFATWARFTTSRIWLVACLALAAGGLVPGIALARWWLGDGPSGP